MAETRAAEKAGFTISSSSCQRYFGFLTERPKDKAIPEECLTCTRMLDCLHSKPEAVAVRLVPELQVEVEETVAVDEPSVIPEQVEDVFLSDKQHTIEILELEKQSKKPVSELDGDFTVESTGALYDQWYGTVLIGKETLQSWGKTVKDVEIQTHKGNKTTCKVYGLPNLGLRVVQIPTKIKADLGIHDGSGVRVKPLLLEKDSKLTKSVSNLIANRPRVKQIDSLVARGTAFIDHHHLSLHDVRSQVRERLRRRTDS